MRQLKWVFALFLAAVSPSLAMADLVVGEDTANEGNPGLVQRFDESGNLNPAFNTSNLFESVQGVTVGPDGNVYSLQNTLSEADVTKLSPTTGTTLGEIGPIDDSNGAQAQEPDSMAFGPDGFLYVGSTAFMSNGANNVFRVNPTTGAATQYMPIGAVGSSWIQSLTFGPDQSLYFVDGTGGLDNYTAGAQVLKYNPITKQLALIAGGNNVNVFGGIAFAPSGNLAVDSSTGINEYTTGGAFVQTLVPEGSGGLSGAGPIAFGADGDLYIFSPGNGEILRYNAITGAFLGPYVTTAQLGDAGVAGIAFVPEPATFLPLIAGIALFRRRQRNPA